MSISKESRIRDKSATEISHVQFVHLCYTGNFSPQTGRAIEDLPAGSAEFEMIILFMGFLLPPVVEMTREIKEKGYGVWDCSAQTGQTPTEARFYMLGVCWLYEGVLECIQNNFRVLFGFVFPFSFL